MPCSFGRGQHGAGLLVACLVMGGAQAADPWGGTLSAGSDYVFRGVSHSQGAPAAQFDLHARSESGWFGGAWISTTNRLPGYIGSYELNLYGGHSWALSDRWGATVRWTHYAYPQASIGRRYDYDELALALEFDDRLTWSLAASPNSSGYTAAGQVQRRRTLSTELSLQQALVGPLSLVLGAGYYDTSRLYGSAYAAWHLGLAARLGPVDLALTRVDADRRAQRLFGSSAEGRWVLTAARRF